MVFWSSGTFNKLEEKQMVFIDKMANGFIVKWDI